MTHKKIHPLACPRVFRYNHTMGLRAAGLLNTGKKQAVLFWIAACFFSLTVTVPLRGQQAGNRGLFLAGTGAGLFGFDGRGNQTAFREAGAVRKIVSADANANAGVAGAGAGTGAGRVWAVLGSEGIFVSADLRTWENRSGGLPVKTIKLFRDGKKTFVPEMQEIKDLEFNPANPDIMVCATKDRVYLSRDQGRSWRSLGAPPFRTNGIKAAAAAYLSAPGDGGRQNTLTVFLSHSTYGLFYTQPDLAGGGGWTELNAGLEQMETTGNADEVSDIAVRLTGDGAELYASQTFRRRLYRLDWGRKAFDPVWSDNAPFGTVDSLDAGSRGLRFVLEGAIAETGYAAAGGQGRPGTNARMRPLPELLSAVRAIPAQFGGRANCAVLRESGGDLVHASELWLLDEKDPAVTGAAASGNGAAVTRNTEAAPPAEAAGREGLYLPVNHAMDSSSLRPYLDIIRERRLNMIVIDMKDDYGRLRFTPDNPAISAKGRVFRPLDIEALLKTLKDRGVYTVARIVVFKDPELAAKEGGRYAVWDGKNNKAWAGYHDTRRKKNEISEEDRKNEHISILPADDPEYALVRAFYDERWVDPYSEEVWEYTAATAEELHRRGFDEIQFDYIRFPTDGVNLADARYRWQDPGMDMESAMLSFLRHIRSRVRAPISIDIYGANGWYRTGARTGQEVELLAPWVDVICPMYYPSHFEQNFLAQDPPEDRPRRIYYQGTLRTARIGRGRIIVRPYVQAFYLNVAYDRKYYNGDYVRREVEGVRAAGNGGLTYWNNSGRYDDIPAYPE